MDGAGRRQPKRPASTVSTRIGSFQVEPSSERATITSAVLSALVAHQAAYHSPEVSRATRTEAGHCVGLPGRVAGSSWRGTRSPLESSRSWTPSGRSCATGTASSHWIGGSAQAASSTASTTRDRCEFTP